MPTNDAAAITPEERAALERLRKVIEGYDAGETSYITRVYQPDPSEPYIGSYEQDKFAAVRLALRIVPEYERLAALRQPAPQGVQCCKRDHNGDGNCDIHSAPGVLRHPRTPPAPPAAEGSDLSQEALEAEWEDFIRDHCPPSLLFRVGQHVARCQSCRRAFKEYSKPAAEGVEPSEPSPAALRAMDTYKRGLALVHENDALRAKLSQAEAAAGAMKAALKRILNRASAQPCHVCDVADFDLRTIADDAREALANAAAANTNSPRGQE